MFTSDKADQKHEQQQANGMGKKEAVRDLGGQGTRRTHEQQLNLVSVVGPASEKEARK